MYNLKIALRNLYRNALYTWINVVGLAVSLTAAIFILLWVQDEWTYNKVYKRADSIHKLYSANIRNGQEHYGEYFPMILARTMENELAEVEIATVIGRDFGVNYLEYEGAKHFTEYADGAVVDTCFFDVFDMSFIEGGAKSAFPDDNSIVITDRLAGIVFGKEKALGKRLKANTKDYFVSAVVKNPPQNSMIQFSYAVSPRYVYVEDGWNRNRFNVFVVPRPNANLKDFEEKVVQVYNSHAQWSKRDRIILQSLSDIRLYAPDGSETGIKNIRLFIFIAIVLLIVASINYVNLLTARAGKRTKEIGLRKIMGASRLKLFFQLMGETVLMLFMSLVLATFLLYLLTPSYSMLTGKNLMFSLFSPHVLLIYLLCFLFIVVFAGIYPALFVSSFNPLEVFKVKVFSNKRHFSFRSLLIVLQFACSAIFILVSIVISKQQQYMQTRNMGYDRENVLTVSLSAPNIRGKEEAFRLELSQQSNIVGVTAALSNIIESPPITRLTWDGMAEDVYINAVPLGVAQNFFDIFDLEIVEGVGFSGTPADSSVILLNETSVRQMGFDNPLGKMVYDKSFETKGRITGVVKDFHVSHMREPIKPVCIYLADTDFLWVTYVKVTAGKTAEALADVERIWKKFEPEYPLKYEFMEDRFDTMYRDDIRARNLFNVFTIIVILVSCLGLFGLVTCAAEARTKEIGIRKTLGASISSVLGMISREFMVLAGIATIIGVPIAYFLTSKMLQSYAYRISITWWMILTAILAVLILTILTVSAQALRAARANPVKSIKTE